MSSCQETPSEMESSQPTVVSRQALGNVPARLAGGLLIPPHMQRPGEEGFRTPTGEDFEQHAPPQRSYKERPQTGSSVSDYFANGHTQNGQANQRSVRVLSPLSSSAMGTIGESMTNRGQLGIGAMREKIVEHLHWKARIRHYTWTFFTMTMATGGVANVLHTVPLRFRGLDAIGTFFFLFNIVLFLINVICISTRFWLYPETFKASLLHPTESLFMPAAVVSFGTILINVSQYGLYNVGSWLNTTVMILFWVDVILAFFASSLTYLLMYEFFWDETHYLALIDNSWSTQSFTIGSMTPVWIFPAYPLLIIGPHAGVLANTLRPSRALKIIIGGFTVQGIGFMVSLMIYAAFIYRLMTQKLPAESLRPGMFVSVGPSGFTCAGIINMAAGAHRAFGPGFMGDGQLTATILKAIGNWVSLWLWGLALWFFVISVGAHWSCINRGSLVFAMTWYSFVFPQTALVTATFAIGEAFSVYAIQIVGCVMTCLLVLTWIFVFVAMVRAIVKKQILWPQRQEDRDEGGFKGPAMRRDSIGISYWEREGVKNSDPA